MGDNQGGCHSPAFWYNSSIFKYMTQAPFLVLWNSGVFFRISKAWDEGCIHVFHRSSLRISAPNSPPCTLLPISLLEAVLSPLVWFSLEWTWSLLSYCPLRTSNTKVFCITDLTKSLGIVRIMTSQSLKHLHIAYWISDVTFPQNVFVSPQSTEISHWLKKLGPSLQTVYFLDLFLLSSFPEPTA